VRPFEGYLLLIIIVNVSHSPNENDKSVYDDNKHLYLKKGKIHLIPGSMN
jgi:hypothetical protein